MKRWTVKTQDGEILGVIVRFHKNVGTLHRPQWRVWFQLDGQPEINADRRSLIAAYLSAEKTTMELVKDH